MLNKYIKRNVNIVIIVMIDDLKGRMYLITNRKIMIHFLSTLAQNYDGIKGLIMI